MIASAALPKIDTAALLKAAMPAFDTLATVNAALPKIDTTALLNAAMPAFDTLATVNAALPKIDTTALLAPILAKFGTATMVRAAMPAFDTLATVNAALPKIDAAVMLAPILARIDALAEATVTLPQLDYRLWLDALARVDSTDIEAALEDAAVDGADLADDATPSMATAVTAVWATASETLPDQLSQPGIPEVMATASLVFILWVAYSASPELQAAFHSLEFPLWAAPILWKLLWPSK